MRRRTPAAALAGALALATGLTVPLTTTPAAAAGCDPVRTAPVYRGEVPSPRSVVGFDLGSREVTSAESDRYLARGRPGQRPRRHRRRRPLRAGPARCATPIVGSPENVTDEGLARIRADIGRLRDPATSDTEAARSRPAPPSSCGSPATCTATRRAAPTPPCARCASSPTAATAPPPQILANALVVVLPVQNPDGRELDTRRNAYGFDMNRDWFARTQPETDGKLELMRQYPPQMFIDAHEMGRDGLLLPAQRRPGVPRDQRPVDQLDQHHLRPRAAARVHPAGHPVLQLRRLRPVLHGLRRHRPEHRLRRRRHDVREGQRRPDRPAARRAVPDPVGVAVARGAREGAHPHRLAHRVRRAQAQGEAGRLEPNEIISPDNEVQRQVPDERVRHYFLRADDPAKRREVETVVTGCAAWTCASAG